MGYRIEAAETTQEVLPAIASYVRAGRCALFVGAGLSRAVGYPNWRELLQKLIKEVPNGPADARPRPQLRRLLNAGKFADIADECRQLLGPTHLFWFLRRELMGRRPLRTLHGAITQTAYRCIVTTNFDTLLEDAYAVWGTRGVPRAPCGYELAEHGTLLLDDAFFILKAHGSVTNQSSIVFATEDYRRIIHSNPAFQSVMSAILMSNAVVFVGYSLSDPNFRLLLESQLTTFGPKAPPRYALMEGMGAYECALMQRTMGIRVLSYATGHYQRVNEFLQAIAQATVDSSTAATPADVGPALRRPKSVATLAVSIRTQGPLMDVRWHRAQSSEWSGDAVMLKERAFDSMRPVPWDRLRELLPRAVDDFHNDPRIVYQIGVLLGAALPPGLHDLLRVLKRELILLDLDPAAASLPWEWAVVEGTPLIDRVPVMRTMPNVSDQARGRPFVHSPLRALIIGDTQPRLSELEGERLVLKEAASEAITIAEALEKSFRKSSIVVVTGSDATYDRVMQELRGTRFDIVHFTGHAWVKNGAAYMALYDHVAYAAELAMLLNRHPPALLFVNSHHTGFVPAFTEVAPLEIPAQASIEDVHRLLGQRRFGFEHVAARAGVGSFVGSIGEQSDRGGRAVAEKVYEQLLQGSPLAKALHVARLGSMEPDDITPYCLLAAGYPDLRLAT